MNRTEKEAVLHCLRAMIDEELCEECPLYGTTGTDHCEKDCVRLAIKALEQEPCDKCVYSTSEGCQYDDITETIPPFEDCISRQEVLDILVKYDNDMGFDVYSEIFDNIDKLPSVSSSEKPNRWIPVSERLPKKGGEYLLWGKILEDDDDNYCFIGDYHEFEEVFGIEISNYDPKTLGFIDTEIEEYYSVVAWMPLPEPYKAEGGKE